MCLTFVKCNADNNFVTPAEKIYKWLSAPDSSPNYHAAREKCHAETGSWFVMGAQFAEWREKPDRILWIYGARAYPDKRETCNS